MSNVDLSMAQSLEYAGNAEISFWLVSRKRDIIDPAYASMCDKMMRHKNLDMVALGKIFASLVPDRGRLLLRELSDYVPFPL